jgi:hypothetical protein
LLVPAESDDGGAGQLVNVGLEHLSIRGRDIAIAEKVDLADDEIASEKAAPGFVIDTPCCGFIVHQPLGPQPFGRGKPPLDAAEPCEWHNKWQRHESPAKQGASDRADDSALQMFLRRLGQSYCPKDQRIQCGGTATPAEITVLLSRIGANDARLSRDPSHACEASRDHRSPAQLVR